MATVLTSALRADSAVKAQPAEFNPSAHALRGVAALMVYVAHLMGGLADHIFATNADYVARTTPLWNVGTYGVELFFVISGFVILPSVRRYDIKGFATRRFYRLYPLFLTCSLTFVALNAATNAYPRLNDPLTILAGLTFTNLFTGTEQLTPNAWSLSFEVMFYLGLVALWQFLAVQRRYFAGTLVAACALGFLTAFPIALFFVIGVLIRMLMDIQFQLPSHLARLLELPVLAATLLLASQAHYEYTWADMRNPLVPALMLSTGLYFYLAVHGGSLTSQLLRGRLSSYLGTVSYSLYLIHPYIYLPMRLMFARMGWFSNDQPFLSLLIFALAVTPPMLVATHMAHLFIEQRFYARRFRQGIYRA